MKHNTHDDEVLVGRQGEFIELVVGGSVVRMTSLEAEFIVQMIEKVIEQAKTCEGLRTVVH